MNPVRNTKAITGENKISNGVKVSIRNLQKRIPINPKRIIKTVLKILSLEGISPVRNTKSLKRKNKISNGVRKSGEITLCFVNDRKIKELNLKYLGKNNPTDVITFDVAEPKRPDKIFADIVISTDRAIDNAGAFHTTPLFELYLYVIHGVLHILGYDDKTKKDKLLMRKKEESLLKILNLPPITYNL